LSWHVPFVLYSQINTCSCYFNLKIFDQHDKPEAIALDYLKKMFDFIVDGPPVRHFIHRNCMVTNNLMTRFIFLKVRRGSKMAKTVRKYDVLSTILWKQSRHFVVRCYR
jgi:hypothetical protein